MTTTTSPALVKAIRLLGQATKLPLTDPSAGPHAAVARGEIMSCTVPLPLVAARLELATAVYGAEAAPGSLAAQGWDLVREALAELRAAE